MPGCRVAVALLSAAVMVMQGPSGSAAQAAPGNVTVTVLDPRGSATVAWSGVRNSALSYRVLRALDAMARGADLTPPVAPDVTSFVDRGVTPGTTYFYQVIAVYARGEGASVPTRFLVSAPTPIRGVSIASDPPKGLGGSYTVYLRVERIP